MLYGSGKEGRLQKMSRVGGTALTIFSFGTISTSTIHERHAFPGRYSCKSTEKALQPTPKGGRRWAKNGLRETYQVEAKKFEHVASLVFDHLHQHHPVAEAIPEMHSCQSAADFVRV